VYLLTTRKTPSLRYNSFLRTLPPTEARPFIRSERDVKTHDGGQLIYGLVDCAATLDFVFEDFVRRFASQTRKSLTKTRVRLANG
jgi:hypothetical protein